MSFAGFFGSGDSSQGPAPPPDMKTLEAMFQQIMLAVHKSVSRVALNALGSFFHYRFLYSITTSASSDRNVQSCGWRTHP